MRCRRAESGAGVIMAAVSNLSLVDGAGGLFRYPLPSDFQLKEHFYMQWPHRDWMTSDFRLRADREVRSVGFDLMCVAYDARPAGTLPVDEVLLHQLVGLSLVF